MPDFQDCTRLVIAAFLPTFPFLKVMSCIILAHCVGRGRGGRQYVFSVHKPTTVSPTFRPDNNPETSVLKLYMYSRTPVRRWGLLPLPLSMGWLLLLWQIENKGNYAM
jgi:hypothetical protein